MQKLEIDYLKIKEESIKGRYVTNEHIFPYLEKISEKYVLKTIGTSVLKRPIKMVSIGNGPTKILMWSQMHGNESTTTRALLDFINFLGTDNEMAQAIKVNCTLQIVPILNPDGAEAYTRVNANQVDLNRDAQNLSQPESIVLRQAYEKFAPHFCYNLHGQRTIFSVGETNKPATVSFLTPSQDEERSVTSSRVRSMQIISTMNEQLQGYIPEQVGRYDDSFNANCVGDTFQMLNTPTILFEAGHYPNDYEREITREYIFYALVSGTNSIALNTFNEHSEKDYFDIPENGKLFFDVLIKNPHILNAKYSSDDNIGILYKEVLNNGIVHFEPYAAEIGELANYYGHKTFDCSIKRDLASLQNDVELNSAIK